MFYKPGIAQPGATRLDNTIISAQYGLKYKEHLIKFFMKKFPVISWQYNKKAF